MEPTRDTRVKATVFDCQHKVKDLQETSVIEDVDVENCDRIFTPPAAVMVTDEDTMMRPPYVSKSVLNPRVHPVAKLNFRPAELLAENRGTRSQYVQVRSVTERGECSRGSWKIRKLMYRERRAIKERETRRRAVDFRMKLKNKLLADDIDSWIPVDRELDLGAGGGCCRKGDDNSGQWIHVHRSRGWVHCYYMRDSAPMYTRPFALLPFGTQNLVMDGPGVNFENGDGDSVTRDLSGNLDLKFGGSSARSLNLG